MRLMGFQATVFDIAPTILHIYGIAQPKQMKGRVLTEIFTKSAPQVASTGSQ
jgi:predicted AlkP superfamily phosphohydrolase/phosphomutase